MSQPYGQQPGNYGQQPSGDYPQQQGGGYPQQQGGYPQQQGVYPSPPSGFPQPSGYPQAPSYGPGAGGLPQAPPEYATPGAGIRPGQATAAAVLAFVQAGITLLTTIIGIANTAGDGTTGAAAAIIWLLLLAQVAGVVLLTLGGVQLIQGKSRVMLLIGCVLELVICVVYLIAFAVLPTFDVDTLEGAKAVLIGIAIFFAIMPTISLIMALGSPVAQYLQGRRGPGY